MGDLPAGSTVKALDTPSTVSNAQSATVSTTSTTYATAGTDCAVVFTAPTTGRVMIHLSARMTLSAGSTSGALMSPQTRTGGVVGSGTIVEDAADQTAVSHYGGTAFERQGIWHLLSNLTPGAVYNTRLLMALSSGGTGTASFAHRELIVSPAT
ncbi:hypothetical protein ABZ904_08735 [Streptomyces sp. NPDC046900]|uniref:hypothetical protein n=1 Tax=Streptomyces sp. NPDC046900 TaxID=3155473 RepID=UPI0033C3DBBF